MPKNWQKSSPRMRQCNISATSRWSRTDCISRLKKCQSSSRTAKWPTLLFRESWSMQVLHPAGFQPNERENI
jgi:hypothetical protein